MRRHFNEDLGSDSPESPDMVFRVCIPMEKGCLFWGLKTVQKSRVGTEWASGIKGQSVSPELQLRTVVGSLPIWSLAPDL